MRVTDSRTIVQHPDYNRNTRANDIAILFTVAVFDLTANGVRAIGLPEQGKQIPVGITTHTIGFGFTAATGQNGPATTIVVANVTTVAKRVCEQLYHRQMSTFVCARDKRTKNAANVCLGDNGNGLYALANDLKPEEDRENPEAEKPEKDEQKPEKEEEKPEEDEEKPEKEEEKPGEMSYWDIFFGRERREAKEGPQIQPVLVSDSAADFK